MYSLSGLATGYFSSSPPRSSWSHAQIVSEFAKADPLHIYVHTVRSGNVCLPPPPLSSCLPFREVDVYSPPGESLGGAREGREGREGRETAFALNAYEEARGDSFFAIWEGGGDRACLRASSSSGRDLLQMEGKGEAGFVRRGPLSLSLSLSLSLLDWPPGVKRSFRGLLPTSPKKGNPALLFFLQSLSRSLFDPS